MPEHDSSICPRALQLCIAAEQSTYGTQRTNADVITPGANLSFVNAHRGVARFGHFWDEKSPPANASRGLGLTVGREITS